MQVRLTEEARAGIDAAAAASGATRTVFLEVLGLALAAGEVQIPPKTLTAMRQLDAARRSRA